MKNIRSGVEVFGFLELFEFLLDLFDLIETFCVSESTGGWIPA